MEGTAYCLKSHSGVRGGIMWGGFIESLVDISIIYELTEEN